VSKLTDAAEASITTHATHVIHTRHTRHTRHTSHVIVRRSILFILIHPLPATGQQTTQYSPISQDKPQLTLSKSVFKKCIFLVSFNSLGQYSSFIVFL
jgi:hypothetical protein